MDTATDKTVTLKSTYMARGFALEEGESPWCAYADFVREGRAPGLLSLTAGDQLIAISTPSDGGMMYARVVKDGTPYAALLLPDSYE